MRERGQTENIGVGSFQPALWGNFRLFRTFGVTEAKTIVI
jgi:hypothetical protein